MIYAVTSDWHLSDGSAQAETTDKGLLLEFLKWCEREVDHLHLAGDIFDVRSSSLRSVVEANHPLSTKLLEMVRDGRATYYYGNHDLSLRRLDWTKESGAIDGYKIGVIHGHQFDLTRPFGKKYFDEATDYLFDWVKKKTGYRPGAAAEKSKRKWWARVPKNILMSCFTRRAREYARRRRLDGVIYGHMHLAGVYSKKPFVVNSGSCVEGDADYLLVDRGQVVLRDMRDGF